jgi:ribonuclease HII
MPSSNNNNNRRRSARLNAPPSPSASLSSNKKRNIRTTTKAEAKSTNNNNDNNHDDYSSMKVAELRELLKKRGLAVSGVKSQLVERLSLNNDTNNVNNEKEQVQEVDDDDATKKQQRRKRVKATSSSNKSSAAAAAAAKTDSYYLPRTREKQLQSKNNNTLQVIGVDEAGRGPLAGPVVAAAAIVPTNISGIIDSKKITNEVERERLYEELIASSNIKYAVAVISAQRIDEINILQATLEGMRMAVEGVMGIRKVDSDNNVVSAKREEVSYIVTGGIDDNDSTSSSSSNNNNASSSYHALIDGNKVPKDMPCQAEALVKGDGREYSIGAASVLAKVTRDRLMHEYNALYPEYNLSQHKGYPTAAHMSAVSKFGASPIHRRTFAPLKHMEFDKDGKVMGSKKKK